MPAQITTCRSLTPGGGNLGRWTVTTDGLLSSRPYFLRITAGGNANAGTQIQLSDGGPLIDQRKVLDPSFLDLVRLGVLRPDDRRASTR
jgi:glucoamylase